MLIFKPIISASAALLPHMLSCVASALCLHPATAVLATFSRTAYLDSISSIGSLQGLEAEAGPQKLQQLSGDVAAAGGKLRGLHRQRVGQQQVLVV